MAPFASLRVPSAPTPAAQNLPPHDRIRLVLEVLVVLRALPARDAGLEA
jgi:hypothetical protein